VLGGSYKFTDNFTASLYTADNEDVMKKHYLGLNYVFPIANDQSLTLDFNGYKTSIDDKFVRAPSSPATTTPSGAWRPPTPSARTRSPWRTSAAPAAPATTTAATRAQVVPVTVVRPSTWPTPTGPTSTPKTSVPGSWATAWTSAPSAYRA
jgi:hypothetical protein